MVPSEACNDLGPSSLLGLHTLFQGFSLIMMKGLRWVQLPHPVLMGFKERGTLSRDHFRREGTFPEPSAGAFSFQGLLPIPKSIFGKEHGLILSIWGVNHHDLPKEGVGNWYSRLRKKRISTALLSFKMWNLHILWIITSGIYATEIPAHGTRDIYKAIYRNDAYLKNWIPSKYPSAIEWYIHTMQYTVAVSKNLWGIRKKIVIKMLHLCYTYKLQLFACKCVGKELGGYMPHF